MYTIDDLKDIANRYFIEKQTQEKIAKELFCSRSTVSRMIQRCIDIGIVKIKVVDSIERVKYLEKIFLEKFKIENIRICRAADSDNTKDLISILASQYLDEILQENMTIGISRGKTVRGVVDAYDGKEYKNSNIVQIVGIASNENDNYEGPKIIDILTEKTKGHGYYLFVPQFVENPSIKKELCKILNANQTIQKLEECEYILSGINGLEIDNPENIWTNFIQYLKEEANGKELIGTLLGYGFDINGEIIDSKMYDNLIGKSLDYYKDNSKIILVGPVKVKQKLF